jgi:hypothetical protein
MYHVTCITVCITRITVSLSVLLQGVVLSFAIMNEDASIMAHSLSVLTHAEVHILCHHERGCH